MKFRAWINSLAAISLMIVLTTASAKEPQTLMWDQMIPPPPPPPVLPYSDEPVKELDGKFVKVPGFIVPLESDEGGLLNEFLLVPYFGACIHSPPPPPNQLVYVTLDEPYKLTNMQDPYWITGTIRTRVYEGSMATSEYRLEGIKVEKYQY